MIERIRATSISSLAPKRQELRVRLVEYRLQTLQAAHNSMTPISTLSSPVVAYSPHHPQLDMSHGTGEVFDPMFLWMWNSDGGALEQGGQAWDYHYV